MASFRNRDGSWIAEVCIDRKRKSKSFPTKREAVAWANDQEQNGILSGKTLKQAIERYTHIAQEHKGSQSELSRLSVISASDMSKLPIDSITPVVVSKYRDSRLKEVSPVSVRRELIILSSIFSVAIREWGWARSNPVQNIEKPPTPPARRRGISQDEIDAILQNLEPMRTGMQVGQMFRLSIETGMRLSELLSLRWADMREKVAVLTDSKNGDRRDVPLSSVARSIVKERENIDPDKVFTLNAHVVSKAFSRASINGVHFHDARSEAITRLSKKLDVLQLAKMIGHRDIKSLMFYYAETADSMADRL